MELIDLLRVMRRWLWLIIALMVVTQFALWLGMRSAEPVYAATVTLQVSIPQREDVPAYDQSRSINPRDEIAAAINNFTELVKSDEVYKRTTNQLSLVGKDADYAVSAKRVSDADFVNVIIEAGTPSLAAEIANIHVGTSIAYYGELRAQPTKAERDLFVEQLRVAEKELQAAEKALTDFRTQNGIYSLEKQISAQQDLLARLQWERDQRLLEQPLLVIPTPGSIARVAATTVTPAVNPAGEVDILIAQRQAELDQLTALAPQYNLLEQNSEQARAAYEHLLDKYSEAQLKVTAVQAANFIQVIKPASAPTEPESSWPKLAVLALAGSLGLGVMLAFLLQYISGFKIAGATTQGSERKTALDEHTDLDAPQKPIAVQDQSDSTDTKAA